jgi:hypothetical protein
MHHIWFPIYMIYKSDPMLHVHKLLNLNCDKYKYIVTSGQ